MKIFIACLIFLLTSQLCHAEGGGLNINLNNFNMRLEFNDNIKNDNITGMQYIREPSGLLFDLVSIIQNNSELVSKFNKDIFIEADNYNQMLTIYEQSPEDKVLLNLKNIKHLDSGILVENICKILLIKDCKPNKYNSTHFFISNLIISKNNSDLIDFGCFPCRNNRRFTLTDRFTPTEPNQQPPKFTKVTVDRQTIYHYFNKLIP